MGREVQETKRPNGGIKMDRKNVTLGYFFVLIFLTVLEIFEEFKSQGITWMIFAFYLTIILMFLFPILKLTNRAKNVSKYLPVTSLAIINVLVVYRWYQAYQVAKGYYNPHHINLIRLKVLSAVLFGDLHSPSLQYWHPLYFVDYFSVAFLSIAFFIGAFGFVACYMLEIGSKARRIAALLLAVFALVFQVLAIIITWKEHVWLDWGRLLLFSLMFLAWELPMIEEILHWKALKFTTEILLVLFGVSFLVLVFFVAQGPNKADITLVTPSYLYCYSVSKIALGITLALMMMPVFSVTLVRNSRIKYTTLIFPLFFIINVFFMPKEWNWYTAMTILFGSFMTLLPPVFLFVLSKDTPNRKNIVLGYFSILTFLTVFKIFIELSYWGELEKLVDFTFYLVTILMFVYPVLKLTNRAKNISKYLPVIALAITNVLIVYWWTVYHWRIMWIIWFSIIHTVEWELPIWSGYIAFFMSVFGFVACYMLEIGSKARRIAALLLAVIALAFQMLIVITFRKYHLTRNSIVELMLFSLMFLAWELPMIEEILHWRALKSSTKILLTLFTVSFLASVLFTVLMGDVKGILGIILPMTMPAFSIIPVRNSRIKYTTLILPIIFSSSVFHYGEYNIEGIIFGVLMVLLPSVLLLVLSPNMFTTFQVEDSKESETELSKLPPKKRLKVLRKEYSRISPLELPEEALSVYEELKSMIEIADEKVRRKKEKEEAVQLLESIERKLHEVTRLRDEYLSTKNRIISAIREILES
ncbi:hypothetical protein [Thermococcus sp. AM4]|uniref:hypothetical protein n=1 Tax=Thermococcus sp. (strain AM4) TaxID=246969 RepID=UPI000186FA4D|nr:hypothetical protein [Thermococcus sp. AM4]EEB75063.1 hypothetical protein TAM4_1008 [Thermococcus sp. AM4]